MGGLAMATHSTGRYAWPALLTLVFFAIAPHAAIADTWSVEGIDVTSEPGPGLQAVEVEEVSETKERYLSMATKLLGATIENRCTEVKFLGAALGPEGTITVGARAEFSGCSFYIEGTLAPECEPHSPGSNNGVIVTHELKGSIGKEILTLSPRVGNVLKAYKTGPECPIGEEIVVWGSLLLRDVNEEIGVEEPTHLIEGVGTSITVFSNPVTLTGSAVIGLSGESKGLKWSASP
jgi:hypothetical protein